MNTELKNNVIKGIKEVIIPKEKMQKRVEELGKEISEDFKDKELIVIGVLKGSVIFLADLIREISIPLSIDFISASSYGDATRSSGVVTVKKDVDCNVKGKDVLLVEDIIDTGLTLKYLKDLFKAREAKSVSICSALDKPSRRLEDIDVEVRYVGFQIPDEFVVGYGLDYAEKYRNVRDISILSPEIYGKNNN